MKKIKLYLNDEADVDEIIFFLQANIEGLITVSVEDEDGARMLIPEEAIKANKAAYEEYEKWGMHR